MTEQDFNAVSDVNTTSKIENVAGDAWAKASGSAMSELKDTLGGKTTSDKIDSLPNISIAEAVDNAKITQAGEGKSEVINKFEKLDKKFVASEKEQPLTRTEQFMANALTNAIRSNDMKGMVDVLNALSDDVKSAHRVLNDVRRSVEGKSTWMTFQTGRDQDNKPFVQLQINTPFERVVASNHSAHVEPAPSYYKQRSR